MKIELDPIREVIEELRNHAESCRKLAATYATKGPGSVVPLERVTAKRVTYDHAAELLEQALERATAMPEPVRINDIYRDLK